MKKNVFNEYVKVKFLTLWCYFYSNNSTNKSRKRKSKGKSFDHMCLNIGTTAKLMVTMVFGLNGFISAFSNNKISVLSNDKDIADL